MTSPATSRWPALSRLVSELRPGAVLEGVRGFGIDDSDVTDVTQKGVGYGRPLRLSVRDPDGSQHDLVLHTATSDPFGHDRRSDRAQAMLLAFDTSRLIPRLAPAIDVGSLDASGRFHSLKGGDELYLVTEYQPGHIYADDLRALAQRARATDVDRARVDTLADYLVDLHRERPSHPTAYRRAIRDLVGHGEGIFGLIDSYPDDDPIATPARLEALEHHAIDWRWRLRGHDDRLRRSHGDFHPFNILFDDAGELHLLDASRGCLGDPADDVSCLAINYLFFALEHPGAWSGALRALWFRFWRRYLDGSGDKGLLTAAPPFLLWRALVLANPTWYPAMHPASRERLLAFAETVAAAPRFDPEMAEDVPA